VVGWDHRNVKYDSRIDDTEGTIRVRYNSATEKKRKGPQIVGMSNAQLFRRVFSGWLLIEDRPGYWVLSW